MKQSEKIQILVDENTKKIKESQNKQTKSLMAVAIGAVGLGAALLFEHIFKTDLPVKEIVGIGAIATAVLGGIKYEFHKAEENTSLVELKHSNELLDEAKGDEFYLNELAEKYGKSLNREETTISTSANDVCLE